MPGRRVRRHADRLAGVALCAASSRASVGHIDGCSRVQSVCTTCSWGRRRFWSAYALASSARATANASVSRDGSTKASRESSNKTARLSLYPAT